MFTLPMLVKAYRCPIFRSFYSQPNLRCKEQILNVIKRKEILDAYYKNEVENKIRYRTTINYTTAFACFMGGMTFLSVPLYDAFCKVTGLEGKINIDLANETSRTMERIPDREIIVSFIADKNSYLQWKFKPLQSDIKVVPGETVLAFYSAENITDKPISGISTYSIVPYEAAKYFNKIQCFCFDEQRLNPHEQVDMPVFFYIDPEFVQDPYLFNVSQITLSYTFFEAVDGLDLPFMSSFRFDYDEDAVPK